MTSSRHKLNICSLLMESDCLFDSSIQSPVLGESVSMYGPSDDNLNFYKELMVKSCHLVFDIFNDEQFLLCGDRASFF